MHGSQWYGYIYPKALDVMPLPKIFTPDIAPHASFSFDQTGEIFFTGGVAGGYGILVNAAYRPEYVMGLLNSTLLDWMLRQSATQMRGGYYSFESRFIKGLPIRAIDFSKASDKALHDRMVELVERMLSLHKQLTAAKTGQDKTMIQRQIDATNHQIDRLVYDLYNIADKEVNFLENGVTG